VHKLIAVTLASLFAANMAFAQPAAAPAAPAANCETQAVSKDGKPLAGAAKTAFMKKCTGGAAPAAAADNGCAAKALSKDGKPLHGAAKNAFMKKCEKDAAAK
jgi:hypothetical protein